MELQGCYTALITPFKNGNVDLDALKALVEDQIAGGVDGLVPVGTTGESPTLNFKEHEDVIRVVTETAAGRCQVVAGTGANSTEEALELTKFAKDVGADASLQVTPYYNKPTEEGLYRHFAKVADDVGLPIVLYNVPGRSAVPISIDVIRRLASNTNVAAVKEAGGSVDRVSQILDVCDITVLSGDDSLTLPMMVVGAKGVISVASNLIPAEITKLAHDALAGDYAAAREQHYKYYAFMNDIFIETNPIPIKAAMAICGKAEEEYRLPMCEMSAANKETLKATMTSAGIL